MESSPTGAEGREYSIIEMVQHYREQIKIGGKDVKALMNHVQFTNGTLPTDPVADVGEMKANIMLAYRAMEDARMRLGKVIEAHEGGVSIYDKK